MASDDITLREVTRDTYTEILGLDVQPDQKHLVATNAKSLAQAMFHDEAWFRGVYAGDTAVGFLMLSLEPSKAEYYIWRLMIDAKHQGKGYGRKAVALAVDHIRKQPHAREVLLSHMPDNDRAGKLYTSCGFEYTGEISDGEPVMRLEL